MSNNKSHANAAPAYADLAGRIGVETAEFVGNRLRKDWIAGQNATLCRNFGALADIQRDWLRETIEDYAEGTSKILKITAEAMRGDAER